VTDFAAPGYWMNETSGVLRPVVEAYLDNEPMSAAQIAVMRAYLRQWCAGFADPAVAELASLIDGIISRGTLRAWLDMADGLGIDPL